MTAPARTRRKPAPERARVTTPPEQAPAPERRGGRRTSAAAERAYARRAQRANGAARTEPAGRLRGFRLGWPTSRASFVLVVMLLLAAGVAATLLLSTQAIADSYRLEQIRQENANLVERSERLQREVTKAGSASELAERAKALGMVPAGHPAHLVQNPDGSITVVGKPEAAEAPTPEPEPGANAEAGGSPVEGDVPQGEQQEQPVMSTNQDGR